MSSPSTPNDDSMKKAKLQSIMEAASALTALNDEETKRYIPEHKKPDAALTFPEKVCFVKICYGSCWNLRRK